MLAGRRKGLPMKDPRRMKFDPSADSADQSRYYEPQLAASRKLIEGADLLNVGSWTGNFESLAVVVAGTVTGLDVEPRALEVARKNIPGATFVEASVFEMPFQDASFDVVTLFEVIEHLPTGTEPEALSEVARVLRPGGHLVLSTPSWTLRSRLLDPAYLLTGHRHYAASSLITLLSAAGFTTERCDIRGGWVNVASYMTMYFYKHVLRRPMTQSERRIRAYLHDAESPGFTTQYVMARLTAKKSATSPYKAGPGQEK
jgi:ubiquinone/menaquinone biosynthesis C-methylase UbiE